MATSHRTAGRYSRAVRRLVPAAVVPVGTILSLMVVGILLFTGWKGWQMVYRHHVGVSDQPAQRGDIGRSAARMGD